MEVVALESYYQNDNILKLFNKKSPIDSDPPDDIGPNERKTLQKIVYILAHSLNSEVIINNGEPFFKEKGGGKTIVPGKLSQYLEGEAKIMGVSTFRLSSETIRTILKAAEDQLNPDLEEYYRKVLHK